MTRLHPDAAHPDAAHPDPAHPDSAPPTADSLKREIAALLGLGPQDVTDEDNLVYLGLGSLEVMRLATRWRRQGLTVDFARLLADPTVEAWHQHLTQVWQLSRSANPDPSGQMSQASRAEESSPVARARRLPVRHPHREEP